MKLSGEQVVGKVAERTARFAALHDVITSAVQQVDEPTLRAAAVEANTRVGYMCVGMPANRSAFLTSH